MNLRRPNISSNKTDLADLLALQLRAMHLPMPVREHQAIEGRKFRCDLAWPQFHPPIAVEVDGGDQMFGRHARAGGMASDCEKANLLTAAGWKCFRFTGQMVKSGAAIEFLQRVFSSVSSL